MNAAAKPTSAQAYGARRRAIDRALLAELERHIAAEEREPVTRVDDEIDRAAIARAFGRPVLETRE
jgi:hypothetical protein